MIAWARFFLLIAAAALWYSSAFAQIGGPIAGAGGATGTANITGGTINNATIGGTTAAAGTFTTATATTRFLSADGGASAPAFSFSGSTNSGLFRVSSFIGVAQGGTAFIFNDGGVGSRAGATSFGLTSAFGTNTDVMLERDAANTLAQKNSTTAQLFRLYFSTTGPVYWQATARTNGVLYTGSGGSAQVSYAQTTVPTCSTNCGTSPSVAGTDTAGIVTMGATGVPASGWVVTFNGTWPAAPACVVQSALASMVVGKMPIAVVTSTTTMTVTTNGTAPAAADKYQYICNGVS